MRVETILGTTLLLMSTWACDVPMDDEVSTTSSEVLGSTNPPGTTPPPGPVCSGPTTFDSYPLVQRPTVSARSTVWAPAITAGASATNAGEFRSTGVALEAISSGAAVAALRATANAPDGVAIKAATNAPDATALRIENNGTGPLLEAYRQGESTPRFAIGADARFYVNGQEVPEFGPPGDPGPAGRDGAAGRQGPPGPDGRGLTFALCSEDSCLNTCLGGWIAIQANAPCKVGADIGACEWNGSGGVCCVCGT